MVGDHDVVGDDELLARDHDLVGSGIVRTALQLDDHLLTDPQVVHDLDRKVRSGTAVPQEGQRGVDDELSAAVEDGHTGHQRVPDELQACRSGEVGVEAVSLDLSENLTQLGFELAPGVVGAPGQCWQGGFVLVDRLLALDPKWLEVVDVGVVERKRCLSGGHTTIPSLELRSLRV